jgi:hypothetical protein
MKILKKICKQLEFDEKCLCNTKWEPMLDCRLKTATFVSFDRCLALKAASSLFSTVLIFNNVQMVLNGEKEGSQWNVYEKPILLSFGDILR